MAHRPIGVPETHNAYAATHQELGIPPVIGSSRWGITATRRKRMGRETREARLS